MPSLLEALVGRQDARFSAALARLERSHIGDAVDVRLIADITHTAFDTLRAMNLDPANSTPQEIYHSLRAHVEAHDRVQDLLLADYVLFIFDQEVISYNILDIFEDVEQHRTFENRTLGHGRRALMGEIIHRYTTHPRAHPAAHTILKEADIHPDTVPVRTQEPEKHETIAAVPMFSQPPQPQQSTIAEQPHSAYRDTEHHEPRPPVPPALPRIVVQPREQVEQRPAKDPAIMLPPLTAIKPYYQEK